MSQFDRDVAGLEEEGEDAYFAQTSPAKKPGSPAAATTDDEEDEDDLAGLPSVEKELEEKEDGRFDEKATEKKKKVEETEDTPKSDLDFIKEAEAEVELERDAMLAREDNEEEI